MKNFKRFGAEEVFDLGAYVKEYLAKNKDVTIYVGTDSVQNKKYTQFATVVMFYHEGKGAHFVFRKFPAEDDKGNKRKIRELFERMFAEMLHSYEVAEYLETAMAGSLYKRDGDKKFVIIDVDVNPNAKWKSNVAYSAITGFLKGERYNHRTKNTAWAASSAADLIVKK